VQSSDYVTTNTSFEKGFLMQELCGDTKGCKKAASKVTAQVGPTFKACTSTQTEGLLPDPTENHKEVQAVTSAGDNTMLPRQQRAGPAQGKVKEVKEKENPGPGPPKAVME
jgi:hypothetical protein